MTSPESPLAVEHHKSFVAALAAQYGQRLQRFLFKRTQNVHDIPDLAQEVFLRLMRVDPRSIIHSPEAYLFTIASHVAHQHTLRESNAPETIDITQLLSDLSLTAVDDPAATTETHQRLQSLQQALEQLPPKLSAALLLNRFAGYSIEEVGKRLGVARPTAKKYLTQALLHCRNARGQVQ